MVLLLSVGLLSSNQGDSDQALSEAEPTLGCGARSPKTSSKAPPVREVPVEPNGNATALVVPDNSEGLILEAVGDDGGPPPDTGEPASIRSGGLHDVSPFTTQPGGNARWSTLAPDGKQLAWFQGQSLYIAALEGTAVKDVFTATLLGEPSHLTFHPDGSLAFQMGGRLYGWKSDKTGIFPLITELEQPGVLTQPVFSPDGKWLGFVADTHGNGDVYVRDLTSDSIRRLGVTSPSEHHLAIRADSGAISYARGKRQLVWSEVPNETEHRGPRAVGIVDHTAFSAEGALLWTEVFKGRRSLHRVGAKGAVREVYGWQSGPALLRLALTPDRQWAVVRGDSESWNDGAINLQSVYNRRQLEILTGTRQPSAVHFAQQDNRTVMTWTGGDDDQVQVYVADITELVAAED